MVKIDFKNKKVIAISIIALLIVAALILGIIFFPFGEDEKPKKDNGKNDVTVSGEDENQSDSSSTSSDGSDDGISFEDDDSFQIDTSLDFDDTDDFDYGNQDNSGDDFIIDDDFDYGEEDDNFLHLNEFDYFTHQIFYPSSMKETELLLVNRIYLVAYDKYTALAPPESDSAESTEGQLELLIGNTNRQISKDALAMLENNENKNANDFVILEKNGNIAINALSIAALEKAIDFFVDNFMSEDYPTIEKGYCYLYQKEPPFKNATIAGVDYRQWKIVIPQGTSFVYMQYINSFIDAVREATGYEIPLCIDTKTQPSFYEILVGDTNRAESTAVADRDTYIIKQIGSKIVVNAGHSYSLSRATEALYKAVSDAISKKNSKLIESNLNISGKYEDSNTEYNLVFADEFDDDSLSNWINRPGYINTVTGIATGGTVSYAEDERVRYVKDGKLVFKLFSEDLIDWVQAPELVSRNGITFDYGYLEMRAKLPKGNGVYPGFWITRNYSAYPNSPEIDLMEQFSIDNQFAANIHLWWFEPDATNTLATKHIQVGGAHWFARKVTLPKGETLYDSYHTYGCEITEDMINFYFDGVKFAEYSMNKDRMDMFAQLKEIRIGYNKIGSNSSVPMPDKTTVSEFEIEYIHIYQTKNLGTIADHL